VGIAVPIDKKLDNVDQFVAEGKSRNEVGQKLERYVDVYRKSQKQKLTIN
jgi:mevalonate pyrophosphate decarboxylase